MSAIDDLTAKVDRLRQQLHAAEASLRAAEIASAPVKLGDVVADRNGNLFRVCHVIPRWKGYLEVKGNPRKQDGTWGVAQRHVYDWKLIEPRTPSEQPTREPTEAGK